MADNAGHPPPAWERPLELSVHSMEPGASPTEPSGPGARRQGRFWMIVVWLICAAPVVASYLAFYVFRPTSRHSYGALIEPQRDLPDLAGADLDGNALNLRSLKGRWLLVSVSSGTCDTPCQDHLYLQRQLRESLGKDKERVKWVWLIDDAAAVAQPIRQAVARATVVRVPSAGLAQWLAAEPGHALQDHLYLVDPLGHWMMRFPAELTIHSASKAKRDLDRVLRASESWDQADR